MGSQSAVVLPVVRFSAPVKKFSDHFFLTLLSVVLILAVVVFFLDPAGSNQGLPGKISLPESVTSVKLSDSLTQANYNSSIKGFDLSYPNYNSLLLVNSFWILSMDYSNLPTGPKWQGMEAIYKILQKHFPKQFSESQLVLTCRDETCGISTTLTPSLELLKKQIETDPTLRQGQKASFVRQIANANVARQQKNSAWEFNSLFSIYNEISTESTRSASLDGLGQSLLALLKSANAELFVRSKLSQNP